MASKIESVDKDTIVNACNETRKWLAKNNDADKETYDAKMKKLENVCHPIMQRLNNVFGFYESAGNDGGMPGRSCIEVGEPCFKKRKVVKVVASSKKQEAIPKDISDLWERCWSQNPSERPTASELVQILAKLHRESVPALLSIKTSDKGDQYI